MGPRAEFEHDGRKPQPLDRGARGAPLWLELTQGRADENAQPLIRCADPVPGAARHGGTRNITGVHPRSAMPAIVEPSDRDV